ncbi:hypothetical protein E4U17_001546 [Claviceps sp. LM77 group G4]|nr:hypothetical protein E4U17_001546 [Claviceps sp. LM77 group G4]KAG6085156.1 hypothetical protein E4U33_002376 [Claviceps sp. LM78 group G4]
MSPTPTQSRAIHKRSLSITPPPNCKRAKQTPASVPARCPSRSRLSLQNLPLELLETREHFLVLDESGSPSLQSFARGQTVRESYSPSAVHDGYVLESHPVWKKYAEPGNEEVKDEASVQFALLSLPWADIDFILSAQQAWADKYARGRSFEHHDDWGGRNSPGEDTSYAPQSYHQHTLQHSMGESTFDARACFEADYERAVAHRISPDSFSFLTFSRMPELTPPVVPVHLITGPWDEEQKRRLFWLARANLDYCLDPLYLGSRPVEVRLACLDAAVISAEILDPLIIICLMGSWLFEDLPQDAEHERLVKLCNRIDRGGEMVDMEILRCVVRQLDCRCRFQEYHFSLDD